MKNTGLFYSDTQLQAVKERLAQDSAFAARYARMKERAEQHLARPLLTQQEADSVHDQHGRYYEVAALLQEAADLLPLWDFVDGDARAAARAKELLLYYSAFAVWTGPTNKERRTPWTSELSTTRILVAFSILYDRFGDRLTADERKTVEDAMITKGIDPLYNDWVDRDRRIHALDSMGHNWWAVCIALDGIGILALSHRLPDAEERLGRILAALEAFCTYDGHPLLNKIANFDDRGMFYESAGYFSYAVSSLLTFLFVYRRLRENASGRFPVLQQVNDALFSMIYPTGREDRPFLSANFGDSGIEARCIGDVCRDLLLFGLGDDRHRAILRTYHQEDTTLDMVYDTLLYATPVGDPFAGMPVKAEYPDTGLAFWRSGWQAGATMLGIRAGFTWNHAHDDTGSFFLWDKGVPLLIDSGSTSYSSSDYLGYFCTADAHNRITVNGIGTHRENIYRGTHFPGNIRDIYHGEWMDYLLCDGTGPMAHLMTRNYRSFLRLGNELIVAIDDLRATEPSRFGCQLHYCGTCEEKNGGFLVRNGEAAVYIHTLLPKGEWRRQDAPVGSGYSIYAEPTQKRTEYLKYTAADVSDEACFMTVMSLNKPAEVTPLAGDGWIGVQITGREETYRVCFNQMADGRKMHENSNNLVDGLSTDGYITVTRTDCSGDVRYFVAYGSYLRVDGRTVFDSFRKEFFFAE